MFPLKEALMSVHSHSMPLFSFEAASVAMFARLRRPGPRGGLCQKPTQIPGFASPVLVDDKGICYTSLVIAPTQVVSAQPVNRRGVLDPRSF